MINGFLSSAGGDVRDQNKANNSSHIIFNFGDYKGNLTLKGIVGTVIAPNADVTIEQSSAGVLICNSFRNNNCEWHYINHNLPSNYPISVDFKATKFLDNDTPSDSAPQFSFVLEKYEKDSSSGSWSWKTIDTKENVKDLVAFNSQQIDVANDEDNPYYYYRISEVQQYAGKEYAGYKYDTHDYIVRVKTSAVEIGSTVAIKLDEEKIFKCSEIGDIRDSGADTNEVINGINFYNLSHAYSLPLTGGPGTLPFTAGGMIALFISGLMYVYIRNRERRQYSSTVSNE